MLEVKDKERRLKTEKSAVLSINKVNDLFNSMAILLNPNTVTALRKVVNLTESVFNEAYLVQTFRGEVMRIANYNICKRTIKFAKDFFSEKDKKYVLEVKDVSETETVLEILYKKVSILKICFSAFLPIKFEFLKNNVSYEELFKHYQDSMQLECGEIDEVKVAQQKLQNIIEFGPQAIKEVEDFFEEYVKDFSINTKAKYSWYSIEYHDLKGI